MVSTGLVANWPAGATAVAVRSTALLTSDPKEERLTESDAGRAPWFSQGWAVYAGGDRQSRSRFQLRMRRTMTHANTRTAIAAMAAIAWYCGL